MLYVFILFTNVVINIIFVNILILFLINNMISYELVC